MRSGVNKRSELLLTSQQWLLQVYFAILPVTAKVPIKVDRQVPDRSAQSGRLIVLLAVPRAYSHPRMWPTLSFATEVPHDWNAATAWISSYSVPFGSVRLTSDLASLRCNFFSVSVLSDICKSRRLCYDQILYVAERIHKRRQHVIQQRASSVADQARQTSYMTTLDRFQCVLAFKNNPAERQ